MCFHPSIVPSPPDSCLPILRLLFTGSTPEGYSDYLTDKVPTLTLPGGIPDKVSGTGCV